MNHDELLTAVSIHRPASRRAYVVLAEIPQPWREQFQEALRGSACLFEISTTSFGGGRGLCF